MTEGRKDDAGKPRPTLVQRDMANALQQVLQVAEYGARKYAPSNWLQNVPDAAQRYTDAMLRHQQAHLRGEALDPESGLPHMAHAAWCALAVLELGTRNVVRVHPQLSDRAAFEERWAEDARLYWRSIDWAAPQRRDIEAAELAAAVGQLHKDVQRSEDLREVNRQLRKDPEVRRILNAHGTRLVRTASGSILAGNVVIMGPERTPAEYRKGREAIRGLERTTGPLASLIRGMPLYEAAFAEGLLYLQSPTVIAIKDRRGQKVREVHGKALLGAWALLRQMPDVENLLKLVTMRVPERPSREEYWRAELAKDPVCAEGLAKGWLRVRRRGALIVEVIRTPCPPLWRYAREPVTPADIIEWVKRVRPEPTTLRDLVCAHSDMRLRQLFDAGKLTARGQLLDAGKMTVRGPIAAWRVDLGECHSTDLTLKAAFETLVSDKALVDREVAKLPTPKDPAITHWLAQLSRDPLCAALLAQRQLQLIHEPRTMLLKFRTRRFPLHLRTADEAIRWVHDGCRT